MAQEEVEEFLEHFGVKGMRWGSRKTTNSGGKTVAQKQKRQKQIKVGLAVGGTAALAAGAFAARSMLRQYGGTKLTSVSTKDFSMVTRDPAMVAIMNTAISRVNMGI